MNSHLRNKIVNRIIQKDSTLLSALKQMDSINRKLLLVFDNEVFINLVSIGDIQRAIIRNQSLETPIAAIFRPDTKFCHVNDSFDEIKKQMIEFRTECMPILNDKKELIDVHFWEDVFPVEENIIERSIGLPVVIMAGGVGARLKPLTNVLPKPLIPIGNNTILENIFQRFSNYGCNTFYISVNYKADLIEYYILNQKLPYKLHFFKEEKPLGTVGSLSLLKGQIQDTFFVSNCDILIEQDYSEILDYHCTNKNEITIVAALKHIPIHYGIIETGTNGRLLKLTEKPELTFKINSGMYILEPHLLDEIPENKIFHITQLIEKILKRKGNVGVFPISEKSWKDIGSWAKLKHHLG